MHTYITIPRGTRILIGSAARPMAPEISAAILSGVLAVKGIRDADLPQVFAPGLIDPPQQLLRVSVALDAQHQAVSAALDSTLSATVPADWSLLVLVQDAPGL